MPLIEASPKCPLREDFKPDGGATADQGSGPTAPEVAFFLRCGRVRAVCDPCDRAPTVIRDWPMAKIGGVYSYEPTPRVLRDSRVGHTITKAGHDRAKTMQVFLQIAAIAPDSHDPTTNRSPCQDEGLVMAVLTDPRGRWLR